jgi:GNAT superfamily N-acetyltransferase
LYSNVKVTINVFKIRRIKGMSNYIISPIKTIEEGQKTREVGKRVFGRGASLLLPKKPEWGFYAHEGDDYVGGVFIDQVSPREGMLSWIFVDSKAQGHNLGARLLDAGIKVMDEKGLKTQFSLVRADNTASWNMFAKNGYKRPGVFRSLFGYSPKSFLKRLGYSFATGYSTWVKDEALKKADVHPKRRAILKSLLFSLFVGAALSLFSLRGTEFFLIGMAMVAGVTALRMVVAYPIARMYGPVRFDAPQGGTSLSAVLALASGIWWPTFGFFVPKEDIWRDREFARYEGMQALATWMSLIVVYAGMSRLYPGIFASGLETILDLIIIYQVIPFFPFDGMDGAKVLRYSKVMYVIGVVLSLAAIILF